MRGNMFILFQISLLYIHVNANEIKTAFRAIATKILVIESCHYSNLVIIVGTLDCCFDNLLSHK